MNTRIDVRRRGPAARRLAAIVLLAAIAGGCAARSGAPAPPRAGSSAVPAASGAASVGSSSASPAVAPASPSAAGAPVKLRLALDWTPNTNHTGFYVADAKHWYADAGLELDVLPYGGTTPETLLAAGQADCGISFQDSLTFAVAAGAPIRSVMAILQHTAQEIAVLESSSITRPSQLDGKTYAGFGYPNEVPTLKSVIQHDGGSGTFDVVTLDTAAYDALYAKRADFVITFAAWEGIEAAERNIPLRTFAFTDYGFPDFYQVVLACNDDWLAANPDAAKAFVTATARGFELAAKRPDEASQILVAANPGVFDANPELPKASQRYMADKGLLTDETGAAGAQTLEKWTGYSSFLYDQGLLVDANGKALTAPPDYGSLFTNDFLSPATGSR